MGISELRQLGPRWDAGSEKQRRSGALGRELVRTGTVSTSDMALAELMRRHCDTSLDRILRAEGLASEDDLLAAHARRLATRRIWPRYARSWPRVRMCRRASRGRTGRICAHWPARGSPKAKAVAPGAARLRDACA